MGDDELSAESPEGDVNAREREALREALGQAARNAGFAAVAPGEVPTAASLLKAVGGVRGLVESILPGFGFLLVYTLTRDVLPAVLAPLAVALVFVIVRAATRSMITPALAGLAGIGISAALALATGRAEDNFVPGLIINAVSVLALLISLAVRWPLIGVVVGLLTGELTEWRADKAKRRVLTVATWLWVGLFSARLLVQGPLYLSGETEGLAATKLLMGVPLYAAVLWVTWLLVRAVYAQRSAPGDEATTSTIH